MKRFFALAALIALVVPAAYAAAPSKEKPKPANAKQSQSSEKNAAKACKSERMSLGVEAFGKKYGTNHNLRNAFGKCVSGKSKGDRAESKDEDDDEKAENEKSDDDENDGKAAKQCKAERVSVGVPAFDEKYGTNHNLRNAFGKCVSGKSKANGEEDDD
jgi:opacity protein-like surface antigen